MESGEKYGESLVKLIAPDGSRSVVYFGIDLNEIMMPTVVYNADRNLKIESPWTAWSPDDFFDNPRLNFPNSN